MELTSGAGCAQAAAVAAKSAQALILDKRFIVGPILNGGQFRTIVTLGETAGEDGSFYRQDWNFLSGGIEWSSREGAEAQFASPAGAKALALAKERRWRPGVYRERPLRVGETEDMAVETAEGGRERPGAGWMGGIS